MTLDADAAYLALKARDARFDGRLFVGVTSTGVYCRPICRVRTPKLANCRFFETPAQAEAERFRPCLKCRPESAPGLSLADSSQVLAQHAARRIEHAVHHGERVAMPALAARLGVSERHLRRIFQAEHGVSPLDYVTTQRLLLAKRLLTDTNQPITQVALASGFDSLRRFNASFVQRYRLQPSRLRRESEASEAAEVSANGAGSANNGKGTTLRLAYRPPYDVSALMGFFARRAVRGIEHVDGLSLARTLGWNQRGVAIRGWLQCRFEPLRHQVLLSVSPSLAPVLGAVIQRVRHSLDLDADPSLIDAVLASGSVAGVAPFDAGARLPSGFDGFEIAVRVILGQQVTVKAARTLTQRLVDRYGEAIETPFDGVDRLFPDAHTLATADPEVIGKLGIVRQRVRAIQRLSEEVASERIELHRGAPLDATLDALRELPGIGEWTAQVIAMRALAWPDAFPASDIGIWTALGTRDPKQAAALVECWRPWRAYAVMRLWHQLETSV